MVPFIFAQGGTRGTLLTTHDLDGRTDQHHHLYLEVKFFSHEDLSFFWYQCRLFQEDWRIQSCSHGKHAFVSHQGTNERSTNLYASLPDLGRLTALFCETLESWMLQVCWHHFPLQAAFDVHWLWNEAQILALSYSVLALHTAANP